MLLGDRRAKSMRRHRPRAILLPIAGPLCNHALLKMPRQAVAPVPMGLYVLKLPSTRVYSLLVHTVRAAPAGSVRDRGSIGCAQERVGHALADGRMIDSLLWAQTMVLINKSPMSQV